MDSYVQGLSDEQACAIAITYLTKDAHDWYIAFSNSNNSMQSWSILRETIAKRFNPLNKVKLARDKLSRWRQAKDVKTFNADFLRILIDIPRISTDEQLDRYSRGLKPYIWAELCTNDYTTSKISCVMLKE
jgi:Retrotransposon gag protein